MNRRSRFVLVFALMVSLAGALAESQPTPQPENALITVSKSTLYGTLAGMVLSFAVMLVADSGDEEIFKVGFVGGTAVGLGYGIYDVVSRPSNQERVSLLNVDRTGNTTVNFPVPRIRSENRRSSNRSVDISLLSVNF